MAAAPICSYPKCTCKGFKAPKWGGNECAICFHFQEKHSDMDTPALTASGSSTPTAAAASAPSSTPASPTPTKTLSAASASLRASSPSTRPSSPSTTRSPTESKTGRPSVARIAPPASKPAETKAEPTKAAEPVKPHHEPETKKEEPKHVVKEEPKHGVKEEPKPAVKEEPKHVVKEEPKPVVKEEPKPAPTVVKEEVKKAVPSPLVENTTPKQSPRASLASEPETPYTVDVEAASEEYHEEPAHVLSPSKPRPSSVAPTANFAQNLPHMFPLVSKQVGMGLYGVKRIATTLKEVCSYQKGCPSVEAMIKDSENRTAVHRHAEGHDDMQMLFQFASSAILGTLGQYISKAHANFLSKVDNEATGLMSFYTSSERIRASLIEEAKKAEAVVTNAANALKKEREVVEKQYAQLQAKKQTITKMSEEERKKKGPGEEKTFYALRQKTAEVFGAYEKQVEDTAEMQVKYYNGKLPRIMTELEALEKSRLQMLNDKFLKYNRMLQEHIDEITAIRDSIQLIPSTLDPDQAMVDFVETVTARLGHATPNLPAYYDFHVTADEVLTEPIDDAADAIAGQKASLKAGDAMAALSGKYGTVGGEGKKTLGSRAKRALLSKTVKKEAFEQAHKESSAAATTPVESAGENQLVPGTVVVGLFPYKSDAPEELQFNAGDSITVSESVGTWWRGKLNGHGADLLFPYNFVAVDDKVRCVAMFDFAPGPELENPEEYLTFKVGDIIEATSSTDAWWHGTVNGRQGYFPFAFTQLK